MESATGASSSAPVVRSAAPDAGIDDIVMRGLMIKVDGDRIGPRSRKLRGLPVIVGMPAS
jgi:hypothetical protein